MWYVYIMPLSSLLYSYSIWKEYKKGEDITIESFLFLILVTIIWPVMVVYTVTKLFEKNFKEGLKTVIIKGKQ